MIPAETSAQIERPEGAAFDYISGSADGRLCRGSARSARRILLGIRTLFQLCDLLGASRDEMSKLFPKMCSESDTISTRSSKSVG